MVLFYFIIFFQNLTVPPPAPPLDAAAIQRIRESVASQPQLPVPPTFPSTALQNRQPQVSTRYKIAVLIPCVMFSDLEKLT